MRSLICSIVLLGASPVLLAQDQEARRFGLKPFEELYPQDTAKAAFASALDAINKGRYDYFAAHLLDPAFVDEQLRGTLAFHEKRILDQAERDGVLRPRPDLAFVKSRLLELAVQTNFDYLVRRLQQKHTDDPQALKDLRRMLSEGVVQETGDSATIRLKDLKDRAVYLKRVNKRWFIENRINDEATEK